MTAASEIQSFHTFLQKWIAGQVQESKSLFKSEIADHFEKNFEYVMPNGAHIKKRETLRELQSAYGTDPRFQIKIKIRSVRTLKSGLFLVLYEELQTSKRKKNRRLSLAVLRQRPSSKKVTWLHCHESPLPK